MKSVLAALALVALLGAGLLLALRRSSADAEPAVPALTADRPSTPRDEGALRPYVPELARAALGDRGAPPRGDEREDGEAGTPRDGRARPAPGEALGRERLRRLAGQALYPLPSGPFLRELYDGEHPVYEAQQVQDADGDWVLEGSWSAWYENGEQWEQGAYRADVEHGPWRWWYEDGNEMAAGSFDEGRKVGAWTYWYESGAKLMDAYYEAGEGAGHWVKYHENGLRAAEGDLVDDELSGRWTIWDEQGDVDPEHSGWYEHGERVGD